MKKPVRAVTGEMLIRWECPSCRSEHETPMEVSDIEGGCMGHDLGEYCYCPSREYRQRLKCVKCELDLEVYAS